MPRRGFLDLAVFFVLICHIANTPFSKVEESFGLQATHDLVYHGRNLSAYDHHLFPGVVPRTFLGAVAIAVPSWPVVQAAQLLFDSKEPSLFIVRGVLALHATFALSRLRSAVSTEFGDVAAIALTIMNVIQFHVPFYLSRTLPNTFALILVIHAVACWIRKQHSASVGLIAVCCVAFRADTLVFAAPIAVALLLQKVSFCRMFAIGAVATILTLVVTIGFDSIMWRRWLWPEGEVLFFNTVLNKSHQWGTLPLFWYFYSALPRLLLGAIPLGILGVVLERRVRVYALCALVGVMLYSLLPHKEIRFIFPAVPLWNIAAAVGLQRIWQNRGKPAWALLLMAAGVCLAGTIVANVGGLARAAHHNYPGATALRYLHQHERQCNSSSISVHIDAAAAMTGISRFLEQDGIGYSKNESLTNWSEFTHLVSGAREVNGFRQVYAAQGFVSFSWKNFAVHMHEMIFVLRRNDVSCRSESATDGD